MNLIRFTFANPFVFMLTITICVDFFAEYESAAQVAVDFVDSQRKLAEKTIEEAMQQILDAQPPPIDGQQKPSKVKAIDLDEFFTLCEVFYDICPEVKVLVHDILHRIRFCKAFFCCRMIYCFSRNYSSQQVPWN